MQSYLIMMSTRLLEMKRILKDTGSIYLHCDPTASHYLKLVLDSIFGNSNFRNEIVWKRTSTHNDSAESIRERIHDILLYYVNKRRSFHVIMTQYEAHDSDEYVKKYYRNKACSWPV